MAFKLKPIKPKANVFNFAKVEKAVRRALERGKDGIVSDFEATVQTWSNAPTFIATPQKDGYLIGTDSAIYGYVDQGTPPHVIVAKPGKMLVFGVGGSAKTRPGVIGSGAGARGDTRVFAKQVQHPGTEARDFTGTIKKKWDAEFPLIVAAELGDALGGID